MCNMKAKAKFATGPRLRLAREMANFKTTLSFAETHGIPIGTYGNHEAGSRGLDLETAEKYARLLNIRAAWLAFGEEPMRDTGEAAETDADQAPLAERVAQLAKSLTDLLAMDTPSDGYVAIPPLARRLADVIERAGFVQVPSKSEPTSASKS